MKNIKSLIAVSSFVIIASCFGAPAHAQQGGPVWQIDSQGRIGFCPVPLPGAQCFMVPEDMIEKHLERKNNPQQSAPVEKDEEGISV